MDQIPPLIWVESREVIHSCVAYTRQARMVEAIPLQVKIQPTSYSLSDRLGHRHVREFYRGYIPLLSWKPSAVLCRNIAALGASIAMELRLPHYAKWPFTRQESAFSLRYVFILILLGVYIPSSA